MIISLSEQAEIFIITIFLGIVSAMTYDILRIFRIAIKHKNIFVQVEDAIYWICISFFVFGVMLDKNYGEIRFFNIIGIFLGMIFYIITFSSVIIRISNKIILIVKYIFNLFFKIIMTPVSIFYKIFCKPIISFSKIISMRFKNWFYLLNMYLKIRKKDFKREINIIIKKK